MSIFGNTIQLYTTAKCNMGCPHCSSKNLKYDDVSIQTFQKIIDNIKQNNINRVELFANNPQLHPEFEQQIEILNNSGLEYAILCTGDLTGDTFKNQVLKMNQNGSLVFSVDYTEYTSELIEKYPKSFFTNYSYLLKSFIFWRLVPFLKENHIKVRMNIVITETNIAEVYSIIRKGIGLGFAVSFCYVQTSNDKFNTFLTNEFDFKLIKNIINQFNEIEKNILFNVDQIYYIHHFHKEIFNQFRGFDINEGNIDKCKLNILKKELFELKHQFPNLLLPNESFIMNLGKSPSGCQSLIDNGKFPQLKIGTNGQILFCCDLHDPITSKYYIWDFPNKEKEFLQQVKENPYILLCRKLNPCDFSVNHVNYTTNNINRGK